MMSGVMEGPMDRSSGSRSGAPDGRPGGGREVRWSARRKQEVVLRLLRGESLDALARETGQAAAVERARSAGNRGEHRQHGGSERPCGLPHVFARPGGAAVSPVTPE